MLFRIGLPNPNEMEPEMYFAQIRIALKAAEKAYEEATKNLTTEQKKELYLMYRHPAIEDRELDKDAQMLVHTDELGDELQNIELEINSI